jgi:hypothetical protein
MRKEKSERDPIPFEINIRNVFEQELYRGKTYTDAQMLLVDKLCQFCFDHLKEHATAYSYRDPSNEDLFPGELGHLNVLADQLRAKNKFPNLNGTFQDESGKFAYMIEDLNDENSIVEPSSVEYDLFFAFRVSQLEELKALHAFLIHHLNLADDKEAFKAFLLRLSHGIGEALWEPMQHDLVEAICETTWEPIIPEKTIPTESILEEKPLEETSDSNGPTMHQQVLALYYIFETIGYDAAMVNKSDLARLYQLITNRETNAKTIGNTNLYKAVKDPLGKSDAKIKADLEYILPYFEQSPFEQITEIIQKDLDSYK